MLSLQAEHTQQPCQVFNGNAIIQHFAEKGVGATDALPGKLDDVPFHVHCMKEPDYVMMLMSTYGTLAEVGEEKMTLQGKWAENGEDFQIP